MSHDWITQLLEEHLEAIEALHRQISTHVTIVHVLENLDSQVLTEDQALLVLEQHAARANEPRQVLLYRQTIESVRQMQHEEL